MAGSLTIARKVSRAFKQQIDWDLEDPAGHESTLIPLQAKAGKNRWLWSHRRLKGAVELQEPDRQVFIHGNHEQQMYLIELVKQFTEPWAGAVPLIKDRHINSRLAQLHIALGSLGIAM